MKLKQGFELREICGERVVIGTGIANIDFSKLINLNETAGFLWKAAERLGAFTSHDLADELCKEYEVEPAAALHDVEEMLMDWAKLGLLEE
ncbi:MAG: PqqD family protein [Alloprevotella sp.]|nr:PqqD family protein [Alloprevotella sp.]